MRRSMRYLLAIGFIGIVTATPALAAEADAQKPRAEVAAKEKKEKKAAAHAFHGKLSAMDKAAMTITVEEKGKPRVIHITSHTRTSKAGKPATLIEAVIGEEVSGQAIKSASGDEEATSLRLAAKAEAKPNGKKAKKSEGEKKKE